jgi:hypothetical protein
MRQRTRELENQLNDEMARVHDRLNTEIVPYGAYEPDPPVEIPVRRPDQ